LLSSEKTEDAKDKYCLTKNMWYEQWLKLDEDKFELEVGHGFFNCV